MLIANQEKDISKVNGQYKNERKRSNLYLLYFSQRKKNIKMLETEKVKKNLPKTRHQSELYL